MEKILWQFFVFLLCLVIIISNNVFSAGFQGYHNYEKMTTVLKNLADSHSKWLKLSSLGKTSQNREIWLVTVTENAHRLNFKKPALLVAANLEANQIFGSELVLECLNDIVHQIGRNDSLRMLLKRYILYFIPRVNPDGAERMFVSPVWEDAGNATVFDDDHDGLVDEDPPNDLNQDGWITLMRVKEPGGKYMVHPEDCRLLKKADPTKNEMGVYNIYLEGRDDDGDKKFNEDAVSGVNINQNFPFKYPYFRPGSGFYPVSENESRALADFLSSHENIVATLIYGSSDNLIHPPETRKKSKINTAEISKNMFSRHSSPAKEIDASDIYLYKFLSQKYRKIVGLKDLPFEPSREGTFADYGYFAWGVISLTTPGWSIPDSLDEDKKPSEGKVDQEMGRNKDTQPRTSKIEKALVRKFRQSELPDEEKKVPDLELKLLRWFDREKIDGYIDWKPFKHPDFPDQQVEIGGFKPFYRNNPPVRFVKELAPKHVQFIQNIVSLFPKVEIVSFKIVRKESQVFHLKAVIQNYGFFPTLTAIGSKMRLNRPTKVELRLNGQQLLSGKKINFIKRLEGN